MPINPVRNPGLLPVPGQGPIRPMFRSLSISASGLSAQRLRIETIAQNIANADVAVAPGTDGYKRRTVMLETANETNAQFASLLPAAMGGTAGSGVAEASSFGDSRQSIEVPLLDGLQPGGDQYGVAITGVAEEAGEYETRYDPTHPYADASGYVRYPKIETTMEMSNLLDAKRLYEANASVFQATKSMLRAALDI